MITTPRFGRIFNRYSLVRLLFILVVIIGLALLSVQYATAQVPSPTKLFAANDPSYYYFGRTERAADTIWTWPGSGLRVAYSNSPHVSIRLWAQNVQETPSLGMPKYVWYRVDRGRMLTCGL